VFRRPPRPHLASPRARAREKQEDEDGHAIFADDAAELLGGSGGDEADDEAAAGGDGFAALRRRLLTLREAGGGEEGEADEFFGDGEDDEVDGKEGSDGSEGGGEGSEAEKAAAAAQRAALQRLVEEYYKLDYEDNIGGLQCRFRYREVRTGSRPRGRRCKGLWGHGHGCPWGRRWKGLWGLPPCELPPDWRDAALVGERAPLPCHHSSPQCPLGRHLTPDLPRTHAPAPLRCPSPPLG
jgi:hypothetical protein